MKRPILLIILVLIALCGCKHKTIDMTPLNEKLKIQKESLAKNKITCLKAIIGDSINNVNHVIFLYNGFDCITCIDKGYELAKKIDSIVQKQTVQIISTSANIGADQLRNEYMHFVHNDEHDLIRRELKYLYTPVLLSFDSTNRIDAIFYPNKMNEVEENAFVMNCLENVIERGK